MFLKFCQFFQVDGLLDYARYGKKRNGFSLISVLSLGAVCSAFIAATATILIPLYRASGNVRTDITVENTIVSAANFLVSKLNDPSSRMSWDCVPGDGPRKFELLSKISTEGADNAWLAEFRKTVNAKLEVEVSEVTTIQDVVDNLVPEVLRASIEVPIDSKSPWSLKSVQQAPLENWRLIRIKTNSLGYKSFHFLLRPKVFAPIENESGGSSPLFSGAISTTDTLLLGGLGDQATSIFSTRKKSVNGGPPKDVDANVNAIGSVAIESNGLVGGNLKFFKDPANMSGNFKIAGTETDTNLVVNQGIFSPVGVSNSSNSFYSAALDYPNIQNLDSLAHDFNPGVERAAIGPSASPKVDAIPSDSLEIRPVIDTADSSQSSNLTKSVYVTDKLKVSTSRPLSINPSDGPTRIFVNDNGSTGNIIDIQNSINIHGGGSVDASNFQIFYNGAGSITIRNPGGSATNVNAMIYAPNATVFIGMGQDGTKQFTGKVNYSGGIVARNLIGSYNSVTKAYEAIRGANFTFNPDWADASQESTRKAGLTSKDPKSNSYWNDPPVLEVVRIARDVSLN